MTTSTASIAEKPAYPELNGLTLPENTYDDLASLDAEFSALVNLGRFLNDPENTGDSGFYRQPNRLEQTSTSKLLSELEANGDLTEDLVTRIAKVTSQGDVFEIALYEHPNASRAGHDPHTKLSAATGLFLAMQEGKRVSSKDIRRNGLDYAIIVFGLMVDIVKKNPQGTLTLSDLEKKYSQIIECKERIERNGIFVPRGDRGDRLLNGYNQIMLTQNEVNHTTDGALVVVLADFYALFQSIPTKYFEHYIDLDSNFSAEEWKTRITSRYMQRINMSAQRESDINSLFDELQIEKDDPDLHQMLLNRAIEVHAMYRYIQVVNSAQRSIDARVTLFQEEARTEFDKLAQQLNRSVHSLQEKNIDHAEGGTQEEVIGSLAVENAITDIILQHGGERPHISRCEVLLQNARYIHTLIEHTVREQAESDQRAKAEALLQNIAAIESRLMTTGSQLRKIPNGLILRRGIEQMTDDGRGIGLFKEAEARNLSGLILKAPDDASRQSILEDLYLLKVTWSQAGALGRFAPPRQGIIRTVDTLSEWRESLNEKQINKLTSGGLKPLIDFADSIMNYSPPTEDINTVTTSTEADENDVENETTDSWRIAKEFSNIELIQAFPPGANEQELKSDLSRLSEGYNRDPIEWARIESLIDLKNELERGGLQVITLRLMQSKWHPLPHYVLEVDGPNNKVAIIESPIYGNATYILASDDWRVMVEDYKQEVRDVWGGIAKVHAPHTSLQEHRDKVINVTRSRM